MLTAVAIVLLALELREDVLWPSWVQLALFAIMTLVAETFAFSVPLAGSVSLAFSINFAVLLLGGGVPAVAVASVGVTVADIRAKKSPWIILFNMAQFTVAVLVASNLLTLCGVPPILSWKDVPETSRLLLGWNVSAVGLSASNLLMVSCGIALARNITIRDVMETQQVSSFTASMVVMALLGMLLAVTADTIGLLGVALLLVPFLAARRTFRVYVELSQAFTDTVRSLVAAIEAKDPYTRGHSERVAMYARRLAEALHLSRTDLDLLERAALLHDVGKIGISQHTLTSPQLLTEEEIRSVRQHPALGSQLVGDVEFLSDIVPIIRHHHERVDGTGYPDGLAAEDIPRLARLLAVADAYDAMTSDRAYRLGMSPEEALDEVERVAGTQLDRRHADAFVSMIRDEIRGLT
ncbi:MAG: HD-GYP domain-containing protein [Coriobacteriia bacterium]